MQQKRRTMPIDGFECEVLDGILDSFPKGTLSSSPEIVTPVGDADEGEFIWNSPTEDDVVVLILKIQETRLKYVQDCEESLARACDPLVAKLVELGRD